MLEKYRIGQRGNALSPRLRERLQGVETATIGHFECLGFIGCDVRPVFSAKVIGSAVTVAAPGRDGAIVYKAIDLLAPGDVLVIARVDQDAIACVGGGVAAAAKARGAAAIVLDGPCTDIQEIRSVGLPIWCRGVSSRTTSRVHSIGGSINLPIACGGTAVLPGYAVLADEEGVFVADQPSMMDIAETALERQERSRKLRSQLEAGISIFQLDETTP